MEGEDTYVYVYDRRQGDSPPSKINLGGTFKFSTFRDLVKQGLKLTAKDKFIICTTSRDLISDDETYQNLVNADETLYVLHHLHQELSAPAAQRVEYVPHHDTIVKSGMYEYYASEGQNPLSFAFAELIDNSLSATRTQKNRSVEVQLVFDDNSGHSVYVIDNGMGMSTRKLNDWAIYRLSKQSRHHSDLASPVESAPAARFLNSDISYFGVGGKQAIFFIGSAVRMITREVDSDDVHELFLSKDSFDQKARDRVPVYTGEIVNRQPGDAHHVQSGENDHLKKFIKSEADRPNFTAVVITGVSPGHVQYLRYHFHHWCRQLAHIYHYYLHGPEGNSEKNDTGSSSKKSSTSSAASSSPKEPFDTININVSLIEKGKPTVSVKLQDINDDLQTQYIRSASTTFEFCCHVDGVGPVEGILRYHPFHFDHETIPHIEDPHDTDADGMTESAGSKLSTFECYWNGRLIPYTTIKTMEWCQPRRHPNIPEECFHRVSGVLFCDSHFQVSTNKLTFIDLPSRLQEKTIWYTRVVRGAEQRCPNMQRVFMDWLKESHGLFDKQVRFTKFTKQIKRTDVSQKRLQAPWSVFESIEWDGKTFQKGQLVRIHRVMPVVLGRVKRFMLFGDYEEGEVFATGGEIEISQEPASLYSESRVFPLSKLDRSCTAKAIEQLIAEEEKKLPTSLDITFPDGNPVKNQEKLPCDSILGAIGVEILNGYGDPMSKLVGERQKQLMVEQRIVHHTPGGDKDIVKLCSRHGGKKWAYWFGAVEFRSVGTYTLTLQATVSGEQSGAGTLTSLPSVKIKFTVVEGKPVKFSVGVLDGPFRIGKPFQMPISLHDKLENRTPLPTGIAPTLSISGMQVSFKDTTKKGGECIMNGVVILGKVESANGKDVTLSVQIPSLNIATQKMKIRLLPGTPGELSVTPGDDDTAVNVESGSKLELHCFIKDAAGNPASDNRMTVNCKLSGAPHLETMSATATNGEVVLSCVPKVALKNMKPVVLKAVIDMPHHRNAVSSVERQIMIVPSSRPASIQIHCQKELCKAEVRGISDDGEINGDSELALRAGEILSGLRFVLLDEGGREVALTDDVARKLRVNWVAKTSLEQIKKGLLPDIKTPSAVAELKFCQVSFAGQTPLDTSFSILPMAGPLTKLKCISTNNLVRIECPAQAPLIVTLHDAQGNQINRVTSLLKPADITVIGSDLASSDRPEITNECVKIRNIQFTTTKVGNEEIVVKVGDISATFIYHVIPGKPTQLRVVDCQPDEAFTIYNDGRLPIPLIVQLFDAFGNPCALEGIRIQLGKSAGLKLSPPVQHQRTDANGRVNFGFTSVRADRGQYLITPRATYGQQTIVGANLRVSIEPDPSKAVAVDVTCPDSPPRCHAGEHLPDMVCTVVAEDGQALALASSRHIKMELLRGNSVTTTFSPSTPGSDTGNGEFLFSGQKAPLDAGILHARFTYNDGSVDVQSKTVDIEVQPGQVCRLAPDQLPSAVAVSNGTVANQRKIVENLRLRLQDEYGNNCTASSIGGHVRITLQPENNDPRHSERDIPTFEGGERSMSCPLVNGTCTVSRLLVAPDCPGIDGHRYCVNFKVDSDALRRASVTIPPLDLPFLFCNDGHKQRQLSGLTGEKDKLLSTIQDLKQFFFKHEQELNSLKGVLQRQETDLAHLKRTLAGTGLSSDHIKTLTGSPGQVQQEIGNSRREYEQLQHAPRRRCALESVAPHYANDREVIGKVAHLALIEDDSVARVLSWHMGNDMDCCITTSTEKAMAVNDQCGGRQQMLALDSIFVKALPQWDKPLPHVKIMRQPPRGNPQYVKHYLKFVDREEECRVVFGLLLGEVIVLDTLSDAAQYRKMLAHHTRCPTLLTRDGDRIRSTGKFGGLQNKAPPLDKLRVVFGAPPPDKINVLSQRIDILSKVHQHLSTVQSTRQQIEAKMAETKSADYQKRLQSCRQNEDEVKRIDGKISVLSPQPSARSTGAAGGSVGASPSLPRRGRQPANAAPASTPTRRGGRQPSASRQQTTPQPSTGRSASASAAASGSDSGRASRNRTSASPQSRGSPLAKRRRYNN